MLSKSFCAFCGYRVPIDLTCPRLSSVTMPLRRYQTPSLVRQTSSASIFAPLVSTMTGFPPCRFPMPGPLVETGSVVARECDVAKLVGEGFTDGDGEGETVGDGEGDSTIGGTGAGPTMFGAGITADVLCVYWLTA